MATKKESPASSGGAGFRVLGQVRLLETETASGVPSLTAYLFDPMGGLVGSSPITKDGRVDIQFKSPQPMDIDIVVGPSGESMNIRRSNAYTTRVLASEWKPEGNVQLHRFDLELPRPIWEPWLPFKVCISGHVRKTVTIDGATTHLPVPFVTVEVFDVDRNSFNIPELFPQPLFPGPVLRIPERFPKPKFPPDPDPGPEFFVPFEPQATPFKAMSLEQPLMSTGMEDGALQPLEALVNKTITSRLAPWRIFPRSFYSKKLVATTTTNCSGAFSTCFTWYPLQFRNGRLRFDAKPDIILRVTQMIDGVATVIYLDPYASTRWNTTSAHIDLFLDDERIVAGSKNCGHSPGSPVFFTRIGDDEVYQINQNTGLYHDLSISGAAYGKALSVFGQIGDALSTGAPTRYFRLSVAKKGSSAFVPLTNALNDTRVSKTTFVSGSHNLGPKTVNGTSALYEVRNRSDYYWYNPDLLAVWNTEITEEESDTYVLRLELFDQNGVKLNTASGIEYLDGTQEPDIGPLPAMANRCDLVITLDNQPPDVNLQIPAATNACGVIPWTPSLQLNFGVHVSQPGQRVRSWVLSYIKGLGYVSGILASATSATGLPGTINTTVSGGSAAPPPGTNMLRDLDTTCAFAVTLSAWAHIRNGYGFIYQTVQTKAIAVEKCVCS